jgi:PKD repeat protein
VSVSGNGVSSSATSGSQAVNGLPAGSYTYTITAQGSGGPTTQTATLTVNPPANSAPTIVWNTTPGTVASGQSYTISAHGHDADGNLTEVNVWRNGSAYAFAGGGNGTDNDSGNPSSETGPMTVTYTADAVDSNGIRSGTISQTVTISAPPSVTASISATPTSATAPGGTTISWSTTNATAVSVSGNGVSSSATSGSQAVSGLPAGTYTYTITAQGFGGPVIQTATFTVNAVTSVSASISASPTSATAPGASTISWTSTNATSVSVSGSALSSTAANGSQIVSGLSLGIYTYTITAQGPNGPATQTATVTVTAVPNSAPTIAWNTAPGSVASGQSYTISAHGHDADGNLTNVNVYRDGVAYAFAGGGNGTDNDSGNPSTDTGPLTITYTADSVDANGVRSGIISQTVTVSAPAAVTASIGASPTSMVAPGSTTVTWSSANATTASVTGIGINSTATSGSQAVNGLPAGTYTYTITANGPSGPITQSATFTVNAVASVSASISASPTSTTAPGAATISWSSANATSVSVSGPGLSSASGSGSQTVSGLTAGTYTYTIVAQGPNGPATQTATVTVAAAPNSAPTIAWNTAPGTVASGQSYTISAHGHDADGNLTNVNVWRNSVAYAFAGGGNGSDNDAGNPSTDTGPLTITYTAEAIDAAGVHSPTISQTVTITAPPSVTGSISASPTTATAPGSATISWSTSNATAVSVAGNGLSSAATSGSQIVSGLAAGSYTYTLTAQGAGGPITQTATVTVTTGANVSGAINVSPGSMAWGGTATLTWTTANATSVKVSGYGITGSPYQNTPSLTVSVGGLSPGQTTWTLIADGAGGPITRTATINVTTSDGLYGSITTSPTVIYSNQTATLNWTTTGAGFRWVHGYQPGMNGVNIYPAAVSGSTTVSSLPPGDYRFTIEYGPGSSTTRMSFADLTVLGVNRTVAASVLPVGTGSVTGSGTYPEGSSATLTATPDATHMFAGWSGDLSSAANPLTFTVGAQNYNVVANFALRTFAVTASVSPVGTGSVTGAGSYTTGATATLSATPDATHIFTGWSGDLSGSANPVSFVVNSPINVTANFVAASFVLTTAANTGGTVTPGGTYPAGTVVTIAATPDSTHRFINWTGDASGTAATTAVTLDRAKLVQANFSAKTAQTITFDPPGDHGLTSPPFALIASATSGLPVSFSLLGGPAILTGSSVEVTGAGSVTLQANQPGDAFFLPAAPVNQTFNVIAAASLKYRGQSRTLLRDETTRAAPPFVLEKP